MSKYTSQPFYRFKKTHNLPEADEEILKLLVGSEKDLKTVYKYLAQHKAIKTVCQEYNISPNELIACAKQFKAV